ncbi:MAG: AzlD domain-containing protein [Lachnospiraceae bacterium]|jgi:branched-subunit amino acid transport protein|nr:AzlD domain-containing protein [Lachnospiraceae bacterium]
MKPDVYLYILTAALVVYLIRLLPLTLIRREIQNPFLKSFLYYVPYVTLAVMTFPAILSATGSTVSAWAGFLTGIVIAYVDGNLFKVSLGACAAVFFTGLLF